jgi:hypothetical protein
VCLSPLTLSIRLVANINAGHLVLILCRGYCNEAFNINLLERVFKITPFILGLVNVFYLIFELFICLIQVYIFCILLLLYSEEHSRSVSGLLELQELDALLDPLPEPDPLPDPDNFEYLESLQELE